MEEEDELEGELASGISILDYGLREELLDDEGGGVLAVDEEEDDEEEEEYEGEQEEDEKAYEEDVAIIHPSNFISGPFLSERCTLPENILEFSYSFGYECKRYFNLCIVDKDILIFASGNFINIYNATTGEMQFRRCASGSGIGHITPNPVLSHLAVAEKGNFPDIIIYTWPNFEVVSVLRKGTRHGYTHINYSPDGELFCSAGGWPDFMFTIWNWRKNRIMLRSRAYGAEVFNAKFSMYDNGSLTTSGTGHIKFWKINKTFTGLKLQGDLGRFGKTENCNVIGFLALPDEKVVSGSEWGNILVWDGGLIRVEVFRRGKTTCHDAPITQFIYNKGELMTVAMDGAIRIWYYETIELADPPEEDRFIELEPLVEFEVGDYYHKAEIMAILKSDPDPKSTIWFAQDAKGGIWKLDLAVGTGVARPKQIFHCHSGEVLAIQASPASSQFATLGQDGRLLIYDYETNKLLLKKEFLFGGRCLLWLPLTVEESGSIILAGFDDGVVRILCVSINEYLKNIPSKTDDYINLVQVIKPHSKPITVIAMNPYGKIIITGSEDCTIFIFEIKYGSQFVELVPVGFIPVPGPVRCYCWKPGTPSTVLIGCSNGIFTEIEIPQMSPNEDRISYLIEDVNSISARFISVKSTIRREIRIREILEERQRQKELRKRSGESVAERSRFYDDDGSQEEIDESELPELYIPPQPNPILLAMYNPLGNIWLSVGGYDAGFFYEYDFGGPISARMVDNADDIEIHSYHVYHNDKYIIFGMQDGSVRIVRLNEEDPNDFSDYWSIGMHDCDTGVIQQICFNSTYRNMFTCGSDGNIFCYKFNPEFNDYKIPVVEKAVPKGFPKKTCSDIDDPDHVTLEQVKMKIDQDNQLRAANNRKYELKDMLNVLEKRFEDLMQRNSKLPKSQQLTKEELLLDPRVAEDFEESLQEEMDLVKRKLAWNSEKSQCLYDKLQEYFIKPVEQQVLRVYGIRHKDCYVETFRLRALGEEFLECKKLVALKLEEQELKGRAQARLSEEEDIKEVIPRRPNPAEALLKQIMAICGDFEKNIKLRRLLRKYRDRKEQLETRRIEWHDMMASKPNPNKPDPEDMEAIRIAREFIGDYKLKTAADYKVPPDKKITTMSMYNKLLKTREQIYMVKKNYNEQVLELRQRKQNIIEKHVQLRSELLEIAKEIPKDKVKDPPDLPEYSESVEMPERKLYYTESDIMEELPKRHKNLYKGSPVKKKEIKLLDKEFEMLIWDKRTRPGSHTTKLVKTESKLNLMKFQEIIGPGFIKQLESIGKDDQVPTPWEKEFRKLRVAKRLQKQNDIIEEMETDIRKYDNDMMALREEKHRAQVDVKFLQLYLLTLHQEVLILKKFEAAEEEKENNLFKKLLEKQSTQKKINEISSKIEGRNREIRRCEEEIKTLVTSFFAAIADNKFYDFLRRIFKKKYRPPKVKADDSNSDSESDSSSSSGDEEDAKSVDSKDMGPLRLDENVCPPGCDLQLYTWTFQQRSARHTLELNINEEKRMIEVHRKEYDVLQKKIKAVEMQYNECQEDLEEYIREKQRNLNEIETVVILRMHQIQNLRSETELEKLSESIVFSAKGLTNLYKRVGEIEKETQVEKQKHAKNCQHLTRMKIDIRHMKDVIQKLTNQIDETMINKFGMKVDIDDIEESLLKRLVADMHSIVLELEAMLNNKLRSTREKLSEREETYATKVQENTERNNLISILQEEKRNLIQMFDHQKRVLCHEPEKQIDQEDIERLEKISWEQETKMIALKTEIKLLKTKSTPVPASNTAEIVQKILIHGFDGEVEEIAVEVRNQLRDIYEEAMEIMADFREGVIDKEDILRMRTLTEEFVEKLPVKVQTSLISKLSEKCIVPPGLMISCEDQFEYLQAFVRAVPEEFFFETMDLLTEIMDNIDTSIEGGKTLGDE